jgi:hypothetical protein
MMFLLRMLMRRGSARGIDPLHVSMTGVRMGESFLQIGCSDKALLSGLASKVGLSGSAAVAAYSSADVKLAESIARKVGALIEVKQIDLNHDWPFEHSAYDMIVIDDTSSQFWGYDDVTAVFRNALGSVRPGGRIEVITRIETPHEKVDFLSRLTEAGFKPVRILAERGGLRFIEGLRTSA